MSLDLIKYAYDPDEKTILGKTLESGWVHLDPSYPRLLHILNKLYDGLKEILVDDLHILLYFKTFSLFQEDTKIYILIEDGNWGSEIGVEAFGYMSSALDNKTYIKHLANQLVSELALVKYIKSEEIKD